ncbi:hypothetical protein VP01_1960g4 [Puccinia sorghi]|uniref:Uncharacterized protein n=1 Tax=Puccinia sorghi TaxID=27349 RepID=A0A0L6VCH2_9BASI|nr:hypothetical protein VP01_1960g4 [Puccinia sorghi]
MLSQTTFMFHAPSVVASYDCSSICAASFDDARGLARDPNLASWAQNWGTTDPLSNPLNTSRVTQTRFMWRLVASLLPTSQSHTILILQSEECQHCKKPRLIPKKKRRHGSVHVLAQYFK